MFEKLLQNTAFIGVIGVIIGSALSLFSTILSQIILSRKEQKLWENQQIAEKVAWNRNEQKKEKEYLREIYQNSLHSLLVFITLEDSKEEESKETRKIEAINDIHKWVTMLLLRHSNSNLDNTLNSFTNWPDTSTANELRAEIIQLSSNEENFFLHEPKNQPMKVEENTDSDLRTIDIVIDNGFRKQQLIKGIEIPQSYQFKFKLSVMSNSQREKLAKIFFNSYKTIPSKFNLYLPIQNDNNIHMTSKQWQATLDPKKTELDTILSNWEKDFEESYKEATKSLKSTQEL